ncbi:MAG: putative lipid II flippase FtsW [Proteobacteria bacterium]|nr:putative lipid II flippase FtsW [Pseudomonadota bacterium]
MFDFVSPRQQAQRRSGPRGHYDRWLLLAIVGLAAFGIVMVASASIAIADGSHLGPFFYLKRHLMFIMLGSGAAFVATRVELRELESRGFLLMALAIISLLLVFVPHIGVRVNGARRWLDLGITGFQPVEAVKLAVILYMASYLVRHRSAVETKFSGAIKPIGVGLLIAVLLLAQPDFGSALLIMAITVGMIWLAGARMRYLVLMSTPLIPLFSWIAVSRSYRVERLTSFLNPWKDPFSDGFQLTQALIAVGRGHWFGVGLGDSIQKLFYLPEAYTDFILSVIAEELGFVGIALVLGLFALLVGRALTLGLRGVELGQRYAAYVCFGVALSIGIQAAVSVGVNLGVLPTKGLTLPLVSSGGSSVIMTLVMLGVLLRASYEITRAEDARRLGAAAPQFAEAMT